MSIWIQFTDALNGLPKHPRGEWSKKLTVIDLPVSLGVKSHLKEAVFRIVAFAASGTDHVAAPCGSEAIVVFGNGEGCAAAAGD